MTETNSALAAIFGSMAAFLETQGSNPHRVRAYRRAAESLARLNEPVDRVAERNVLQNIPGIGKELAAKIKEFLSTGTIQSYEVLQSPLPPDVADWVTLPGLSLPIVQYLYHRLGIRTLGDLETLVRSHLLRTLPGVTASDDWILAAIHGRQKRQEHL